jgi:hypothetical protein
MPLLQFVTNQLSDDSHSMQSIKPACFHPSGEDAGGGAVGIGNNTGANSGGIEVVHTSYSGPNCLRNNSEKERSQTKTGSKITVPM